ncbi:MAG: hypothetical protein ASARMPRED_006449 [Alectoria sarmentosa]|nr:MAG: hypothetical protein ASARMPRED_006449 [Alectoria sarmentosa]
MPSPRGDRPVRSAKRVQLAPGYVDSSTLLFDSEDEGTDDAKSEGEHANDDEGKNEGEDEDRHIAKKPRLRGRFKAQAKKEASPPPPDTSCLAYYPTTYAAVQSWNKMLGLPPPHPMSGAPTRKMPKREVDAPERPGAKTLLPLGVINKNPSYDETKAGFEKLPGEIRNKIYALVFKKQAPIDFMNRNGFARSAAFLRVNKVVYNEARVFIYSENRFLFGHNHAKTGDYFDPVWFELGWTHIRRFLTDIGTENTSLIQNVGISFYDASQAGNPDTTMNQRRYTYNKDLLWILDHLSLYGKILKLKIGFSGRRNVRMSSRDSDFLNALKGVKTDKLDIGCPRHEESSRFDVRFSHSKFSLSMRTFCRRIHYTKLDQLVEDSLKGVMVRPLPLEELDPRLEF